MQGEVIAGRYELEELLGAGGMSNVYKARDALLERHVVLKVLHDYYTSDDEYVERFRREARAVAQLSHPNIVTVIDRGEADGHQFIVFEYVEGKTLKDLLEETGPLPVRRALELAVEVARGLGFAHQNGLVHRDVKPQNVLLNGDGKAKVTDFGIARSLDMEGVTQTGTVLGTSNYIAPEQASGEPVDAHTDVYSLGVVLFELLTGRVPFPGETFVAVAMRHVHELPPSVLEFRPDVPLRVVAAVARALEKNPADRFDSMEEFAAELEACLAGPDGAANGETTLVSRRPVLPRLKAPRRPRSLWPALLVGAGLLLLVAAVLGVLLTRPSHGNEAAKQAPPPRAKPVQLAGVTAFDPEGSGGEHNADAPKATDGDPATFWTTETYRSFTKAGVGLVLDARRAVRLSRLTVSTDTPGFTALIKAGSSPQGPFAAVSDTKTVGGTTVFRLHSGDARYYLVWITKLAGRAHVNEVKGF